MTPDHSETEEIHLVTGAGKSAFICETVERALLRWEELGKPTDWRVCKVTTLKDDITPREMRPPRTKPQLVLTDNAPLAISA